jgi:hypothetical protein
MIARHQGYQEIAQGLFIVSSSRDSRSHSALETDKIPGCRGRKKPGNYTHVGD